MNNFKNRIVLIIITLVVCLFITNCGKTDTGFKNIGCRIKLDIIRSYVVNKELSDYKRWYDIIIEEGNSEELFKCPTCKQEGKIGTYIINKHYESLWDTPEDKVLVFEGSPGWNQYGDANDILPLHQGGCNILFTSGRIKFVKEEDFDKLVWNASGDQDNYQN